MSGDILELKAALNVLRHKMRQRDAWRRRHLLMVDSQVALGAISKGRSSQPGVNDVCRKLGALQLAYGIRIYSRWVPMKWNVADGPSRGHPIGPAPESVPARVRFPRLDSMPEEFKRFTGYRVPLIPLERKGLGFASRDLIEDHE